MIDLISVALKGDIQHFKSYIALGWHKLQPINEQVIITIFKHAIEPIQEEFYQCIDEDCKDEAYLLALLHGKITPPSRIVSIRNKCNIKKHELIHLINLGLRIKIEEIPSINDTDVLKALKASTWSGQTPIPYYDSHIIAINPALIDIFTLELDEYHDYDYKILSFFIRKNKVSYHTMIPSDKLCDILKGIRGYIPNFSFAPSVFISGIHLFMCDLIKYVEVGLLTQGKFYVGHYNKQQLLQYRNFIAKACLDQAYIDYGWEELLPLEPIESCSVGSEDSIYRLRNVFTVRMELRPSELSDDALRALSHVNQVIFAILDCGSLDFSDIVLLYHFLDMDYEYKPLPRCSRDLIPYKEGIRKLWKKHHQDPYYVGLVCKYVPSVVPTLEPPLDIKYYGLVNRNLYQKIFVTAFGDITILI